MLQAQRRRKEEKVRCDQDTAWFCGESTGSRGQRHELQPGLRTAPQGQQGVPDGGRRRRDATAPDTEGTLRLAVLARELNDCIRGARPGPRCPRSPQPHAASLTSHGTETISALHPPTEKSARRPTVTESSHSPSESPKPSNTRSRQVTGHPQSPVSADASARARIVGPRRAVPTLTDPGGFEYCRLYQRYSENWSP